VYLHGAGAVPLLRAVPRAAAHGALLRMGEYIYACIICTYMRLFFSNTRI
jgi:hypothetical protein